MATRRRTTDLEALKSRLGALPEPRAGASEESEPSAPAQHASSDDAVTPEAEAAPHDSAPAEAPESAPEEAAPSTAPDDVPVAAAPLEDYSTVVREEEEVDLTPTPDEPVDPSSVQRSAGGLVLMIVLAALVSAGFGYATASVMEGRDLSAARQDQAGVLASSVATTLRALSELQIRLEDATPDRYNPEFQSALRNAYAERPPILREAALVSAGRLLVHEQQLTGDLLRLSSDTRVLDSMAQRHLRLTERDSDEIAREMEGTADDRNFGILFDLQSQARAYQTVLQSDDASTFQPLRGVRVTFESLNVIQEGEGANATHLYEVTLGDGQARRVPIYDLLVLPREQLVESVSSETALGRYRQRTSELVAQITEINQRYGRLVSRLEAIAEGGSL